MSAWTIWESKGELIRLEAAFNPAVPRAEGFHLVLLQRTKARYPGDNPQLFARMALIAGLVSAIVVGEKFADWINIHCDDNIGAAEGNPVMHIHLFGRYKTGPDWGSPLRLPAGKGPYGHAPLSPEEIERLRSIIAVDGGLK